MSAPPKALVWAAVLVVVLHGALLAHFSRSGSGGNTATTQTPTLVARGFLVTATPNAAPSTGPVAAGTLPDQPAGNLPTAAKATEAYPNPPAREQASVGYYTEKQVDKAAVLLGEWVISAEPWNDGQVVKIAIRVRISAQGQVDGWELTDGSKPSPPVQESLKDINRTVFSPALRSGKPVASQREVELIIYKD